MEGQNTQNQWMNRIHRTIERTEYIGHCFLWVWSWCKTFANLKFWHQYMLLEETDWSEDLPLLYIRTLCYEVTAQLHPIHQLSLPDLMCQGWFSFWKNVSKQNNVSITLRNYYIRMIDFYTSYNLHQGNHAKIEKSVQIFVDKFLKFYDYFSTLHIISIPCYWAFAI